MHPDGRSRRSIISSRSDVLMPSSAVYPSLVLGVAAAVLIAKLGSGGLTLTSVFLKLFFYVSFALFCFLLGCLGLLVKRSPLKISRFDTTRRQSSKLVDLFNKLMGRFSVPLLDSAQTRRVVVSLNVDKALKEVFDYSYRDYILSWYVPLSRDEGHLYQMLHEDFWEMTKQLRMRLSDVDVVNLVCNDMVKTLHTHFCDLKAANSRLEEVPRLFPLHPCLRSPDEELRFLRCCARLLMLRLLPARDARSRSLRLLLVEVVATKVLKPLVDVLSDPDYINCMLLAQLEHREQVNEHHKKAYTYAPSYEEFIKLISSSSDIQFLKQLRYQIVCGDQTRRPPLGSIPQAGRSASSALNRKLTECFPSLKKVQLPSLSKLPFKSIDQKFLDKSKSQLNTFLQKVLTEERMCQSEALYAFLSPSPEYLKVIDIQKKSFFSLASFLERLPGDFFSHQEDEGEDDSDLSDYGDETDVRKDALAEPCFMLIGEIFELRGMFKWVRKTLIALVQVTFGRTINKQIRDTVNWIFSEQMLVYYINIFRDTFWPNGKLAPHNKSRSESERRETKKRAQQKLLDNIPVEAENMKSDECSKCTSEPRGAAEREIRDHPDL
ncbi:sorting nexin-25 [Cyprinus carpio]|uniref:Sorting nexin-25 n=1 Tax=Cyprinus carpio TaxID=7962 RepID=A0A9R0BAE3_CYPCA|nr:sorting nexin-25 [Cyprinus carpio]